MRNNREWQQKDISLENEIRRLRDEKNMTYQAIGNQVGLTRQRVFQIYSGHKSFGTRGRKKLLAKIVEMLP